MQVAIDNAKRKFDIDLTKEIAEIKKDMGIDEHGLPYFWQITKKDKMKCSNTNEKARRDKKNKERIKSKVNKDIMCPMNYLYELELNKYRDSEPTLPMSEFFVKHELDLQHRVARKVEELIEKYAIELYEFTLNHDGTNWMDNKEEYFLLRSDFDDMIKDIRGLKLGKKYAGLMAWLINRAFKIGAGAKSKSNIMSSTVNKNKPILMKTLYEVNKETFMSCFI